VAVEEGANISAAKNENFFEKCFWWWSNPPRAKNFLKLEKFSFEFLRILLI
jgi:hypothetical protein